MNKVEYSDEKSVHNDTSVYLKRRIKAKIQLDKWIDNVILEPDPHKRISRVDGKRRTIESMWKNFYVPEGMSLTPEKAWPDSWMIMDKIIDTAQTDIEKAEERFLMKRKHNDMTKAIEIGRSQTCRESTSELVSSKVKGHNNYKAETNVETQVKCPEEDLKKSHRSEMTFKEKLSALEEKLKATEILLNLEQKKGVTLLALINSLKTAIESLTIQNKQFGVELNLYRVREGFLQQNFSSQVFGAPKLENDIVNNSNQNLAQENLQLKKKLKMSQDNEKQLVDELSASLRTLEAQISCSSRKYQTYKDTIEKLKTSDVHLSATNMEFEEENETQKTPEAEVKVKVAKYDLDDDDDDQSIVI